MATGGHDIPEKKIRERYCTSRANLVTLMPFLASLRVYDNSTEADLKTGARPRPVLPLHMICGKVAEQAPLGQIPDWAKPLLAAALKGRAT